MDGSLSNKGQNAEWLVGMCCAGLTAVDWVEKRTSSMHQPVVEEKKKKNRKLKSCPLQAATTPDTINTELVSSVYFPPQENKTSLCCRTQEKNQSSHAKAQIVRCCIHHTKPQQIGWCKTHIELLDKKRKDKWPYGIINVMCFGAVDTWWWLVYHCKNCVFQVKKCQFNG